MPLSRVTSHVPKRVTFASTEHGFGVITALLHDVGKTVSHADEGIAPGGPALTMGHGLLGVELICKSLGAFSAAQAELGNALVALLLSRTCFACSLLSPRGHRAQVIRRADAWSAMRNTKSR